MTNSRSRIRFMSIFLALMIFVSMLPMGVINVSAAEGISIDYNFANDSSGYAEGVITLNISDASNYGNYDLYWADDEKALSGYYNITSLDAQSETTSYTFLENIAIPPDATKLIAIKKESENTDRTVSLADAVYSIPNNKINKNTSDEKTLSFVALSDTQLDYQSSVFYTYGEQHFAQALENAAQRNVDFVTMAGDCINNYDSGTSKEWQMHQKIIAESFFTNPIYETNGNHSMKSDIEYGLEAYSTATGLGVDTEAVGDKPYYEITAKNGDHFIFVALEGSSDVPNVDQFSPEQLDWLQSTIEKYYNDGKHIYIFEHAFFHGWGPGDDKTEHYYSGGLRITDDFPGNKRFKDILSMYPEVFCYTGHSHLDFEYNWNYDNENGQTCNLFHIPATACTTHIVNGEIDYTMNEKDSQCYVVESYDNQVISYGLNVVDNLIYPAYTYIVDTTDYNHEPVTQPTTEATEATTESSVLIDVQVENATSYLYSDSAAVYFYNIASGNYYQVDPQTGIAQIPENATNLTLYRCKETWNSGAETKNDGITSYWNKFGPTTREIGQKVFYVGGSSKYNWKDGEVVYPTSEPSTAVTEPSETTATTVPDDSTGESTLYWAIPAGYAESGYTFKMNIKCADGTYPHSARVFTDTGEMYNGMKLYSYTFSEAYTKEYDELAIQKIQMQCAESSSSSAKLYFQYELTDKIYTISELKDKIFVTTDETPEGKLTADSSNWKTSGEEETTISTEPTEPPTDVVNIKIIDNTSTGYLYKDGAAVFLFDTETKQYYKAEDGVVTVSKEAVSFIVYRCNGAWGKGEKTDENTSYWNKWILTERSENFDILSIAGDEAASWLSSESYQPETDVKYYLVGYLDGVDYDEKTYQFDENGQVSMTFRDDSYVYVISSSNTSYWTNGWQGTDITSVTMYRVTSLSKPDKLFVPSGKATFTMVVNDDGTITLSYEFAPIEFDKSEVITIYDDVLIGDVDENGKVNIKDASLIHKYAAGMTELTDKQMYAADVFKTGNISILNATEIQKYSVKLITAFKADDDYVADVSTLEKLINVSSDVLSTDYRYASYVAYSNLKSKYFEFKDKDIASMSETDYTEAYNEYLAVYNNFLTMKENNNVVTVYFCNDASWKSVKAYISNSETGKDINSLETAQTISKIKILDCGAKIYCVTVNQSKWDKLLFTDGESNSTVELDIPDKNNIGYYLTDSSTDENGYVIPNKFRYNYDHNISLK